MASTKLQRLARIRAEISGETYQQALEAMRQGIPVKNVRAFDGHSISRGGDPITKNCPECSWDNFVDTHADLLSGPVGPGHLWFCMCCGFEADDSEFADCWECGEITFDTEFSVCGSCISSWGE
ncbi:hypothetical protein ACFWG5_34640 [Streptomyces hydrogenans]|uniref:hypothetical protein n=1 Tax=Streptomyces TaxID=1883 RepID=UPI003625B88D